MSGYRITDIRMKRAGLGWVATAVLEDLGDRPFPGLAVIEGPYFALRHRRAWQKALRAHGGRLW